MCLNQVNFELYMDLALIHRFKSGVSKICMYLYFPESEEIPKSVSPGHVTSLTLYLLTKCHIYFVLSNEYSI